MTIDETYMQRCLQLAKNGLGTCYPNPMVGSVIVCNEKIIGEGWHLKAGMSHAEVNAINSVKDKSLLTNSTIYINLEPCSHHGKTPPCCDLIIKHKIPKVVIGTQDLSEKVDGNGIERLQKNGHEVIVGILENECQELNKRFFTFHQKKRPYILLKWAQTKDGFIDRDRKAITIENATPNWITNQYSQQLVHQWRSEEQAILVGTNTVINDNPKLNVRDYKGDNPMRLILDKNLRIPKNYHIYDQSVPTIIFNELNNITDKNLILKKIDFNHLPQQICDFLYQQEIQSILIEGGTQTLQTFIDANLWDEALIFIGNTNFTNGLKAPIIESKTTEKQYISEDELIIAKSDTFKL